VALHDQVLINCQFSMSVFSTAERKNRPRGDKRSLEITRHLEQSFRSALLSSLYPRSQIDIYVEVLFFILNYLPLPHPCFESGSFGFLFVCCPACKCCHLHSLTL